jgi:hypothetical protein
MFPANKMNPQTPPVNSGARSTQVSNGPDIALWEWGLVFLVSLSVDIGLEIFDNVLLIGLGISWFIDFAYAGLINFYWWYRGIKPTLTLGLVQGLFGLFMTAGDGEMPFWWLDVVVMYIAYKAEKKIKDIPLAGAALETASKFGK